MNKSPNVILIFCNLPQRLPKTLVEVLEVCRILILTVCNGTLYKMTP